MIRPRTDFSNAPAATRSEAGEARVEVSVIIPLFNEEGNVERLYEELQQALEGQPFCYEILFVNDGSTDQTGARLLAATEGDPRVFLLEMARRFGQTAALAVGFSYARGDVFIPMDGDLQNDPKDIPTLYAKLNEAPGWDVVSGWRRKRHDGFLLRRVPSLVANRIIRKLTNTPEVHDFGCTLKAYRREVLDDVHMFGDMHRFLPAICKWQGARVAEIEVNHRPRVHGISKYGLARTGRVVLDLLTVKFLGDYLTKPIYFFGKGALASFSLSLLVLGVAVVQRFGYLTTAPVHLNRNVLVLLCMLLCLMGGMLVTVGILSELLVRMYQTTREQSPYKVRNIVASGAAQKRSPSNRKAETP